MMLNSIKFSAEASCEVPMPSVISLSPEPSQKLQVILDDQDVELAVVQRGGHVFADVTLNGVLLVEGALCLDRVPILQPETTEFSGNLIFLDLRGTSDPEWQEYGSRFVLLYYTAEEAKAWASQ